MRFFSIFVAKKSHIFLLFGISGQEKGSGEQLLEQLRGLGIRRELIEEIAGFPGGVSGGGGMTATRSPMSRSSFITVKEVWEQAVTALLCGENLLLVGHKATGKNMICRKFSGSIWQTTLGCVISCEYGCCILDRDGYISKRRSDISSETGVHRSQDRRIYSA